MCGVFGYFGQGNDVLMQGMADLLKHRGPDGRGWHNTSYAGIGNTRLAIIDVEHGQQPFLSDDGDVAVVQNGEIYNYKELMQELQTLGHQFKTHSDTETILHAYLQWGEEFVNHLNGMFAIAILNNRTQTLRLYRDRIGIKPLYYYEQNGQLYFASEIKAILSTGIPRTPNLEALHHFLSFNYTPTPFTFFEGIKQVAAGHYLTVDNSGARETSWWDFTKIEVKEPTSEAAICHRLRELIDDATRIRLRSDVEVGAFLSGGVDSSTVVARATVQMEQQLQTFSIGFDDPKYDESPFAKKAAKRFNTHHHHQIVDSDMLSHWPLAIYHCDQPHGDVSFLPTHAVSNLASQHLKVVLTGDGADELFAGYDKYKRVRFDGDWQRDYFESISLLSHTEKQQLYGDTLHPYLQHDSYEHISPLLNKVKHWDSINQMLAIDMQFLLSGNNLPKPDRMGMAVSIEARTPFLDYRIMEYALSLPGNYKLRDNETKYILKQAVSDWIGEDLAYRKKQMFTVPIGDWFTTHLQDFIRSVLDSNRFAARGMFNSNTVQHMLNSHLAGTENHTRILRALVAIELWFRIFIDRDSLEIPSIEELGLNPNLLRAA